MVIKSGEEQVPKIPLCGLSSSKGILQERWGQTFNRTNYNKGQWFKLKEDRFESDIKKKFFTARVVRHWDRLPREEMDAPLLEVLKIGLDGTLSRLLKATLKMSVPVVEKV